MYGDEHFQQGSIENTLVAVWTGEPTTARLTHLVKEMKQLNSAHPEGVFLYNLITARTGIPDRAARELLAKQFDIMRGRLKAAAIVLEHSGVLYTLSRTIIATVTTITRNPFALRVFSDRDLGAQWLSERCRVHVGAILSLGADLEGRVTRMAVENPLRP